MVDLPLVVNSQYNHNPRTPYCNFAASESLSIIIAMNGRSMLISTIYGKTGGGWFTNGSISNIIHHHSPLFTILSHNLATINHSLCLWWMSQLRATHPPTSRAIRPTNLSLNRRGFPVATSWFSTLKNRSVSARWSCVLQWESNDFL